MEASTARPPIADVLREGIRQGLLQPGQPLIQTAIAEAMGVSRIPVREALYTLAAEGVVPEAAEEERLSLFRDFVNSLDGDQPNESTGNDQPR